MSWKILITDGFDQTGIQKLKEYGFEVDSANLNPTELKEKLPLYHGIIVRSATKVRTDLIELCPKLVFIARAGVGLDNIDAVFAQNRGLHILNTPASSSRSVAEIAMAHLLGLSRGLHITNRSLLDKSSFVELKKRLAISSDVNHKTLLLIGFGRIGRELARMAIGIGMRVIAHDPFLKNAHIEFKLNNNNIPVDIALVSIDAGLAEADYISLHSPYDGNSILNEHQFNKMKKGVYIINTSRGENLDEAALLKAIDEGIVAGAGLDVFESEPDFNPAFINHPKVSITPHIGASTVDAQGRIANELVGKIIELHEKINSEKELQ